MTCTNLSPVSLLKLCWAKRHEVNARDEAIEYVTDLVTAEAGGSMERRQVDESVAIEGAV